MDRYFKLSNGVKIPNIGFGTWRVDEGELCVKSVETALRNGYRHIDTASFYKNERSVGEGIRASGVKREEVFVTTKLWNTDHGYNETLEASQRSLKALGLEYIDLYLIHWPNPVHLRDRWEETNADTWRAFEKLYRDGKVRAIGVSNFLPHHLDALFKTAEIMPMVNQIEVQPGLNRETEVRYNTEHGILTEAWAPFNIGEALSEPTVAALAQKHGKTPAQVILNWLLRKGIVPLPKSVTPERIISNIDVYDLELSDEDIKAIDNIEQHGSRHDPDTVGF